MPVRIDFNGLLEKISPGGKYYKYAVGVLLGISVIFIGFLTVLFFPGLKNIFQKNTPKPATNIGGIPHPPIQPLPKGFQSWNFSYGNGATGPKIKTATVDTLTPPKGSTQTVTVTLTNDSPVTKVTAVVYTDNTNNTYDLRLTSGTLREGTWSGVWKIDDTHDYNYHINFSFESSTGGSHNALTFR